MYKAENHDMREISYRDAIDFLLPKHYSGRKPQIIYSFGYYENNILKIVCSFGKPASPYLCSGVCGEEYSSNVIELNRLCVDGDIKIQLSQFVAYCLKQLKKYNYIIISYSDTQMKHNGYIYQATNWLYTGKTKERTDKYVENGKHSRHYNKEESTNKRIFRSSKHRYVYFTGSKTMVKKFKKSLKYPIENYPKGENDRYVLGDYIKPIIIEK